jgi:hypothetical protein
LLQEMVGFLPNNCHNSHALQIRHDAIPALVQRGCSSARQSKGRCQRARLNNEHEQHSNEPSPGKKRTCRTCRDIHPNNDLAVAAEGEMQRVRHQRVHNVRLQRVLHRLREQQQSKTAATLRPARSERQTRRTHLQRLRRQRQLHPVLRLVKARQQQHQDGQITAQRCRTVSSASHARRMTSAKCLKACCKREERGLKHIRAHKQSDGTRFTKLCVDLCM